MAEIPPKKGKPVFTINKARMDVFHLPVFISLFGLIGFLILLVWIIAYLVETRDLWHGVVMIPFFPLILSMLTFFVIPGSKQDYIHVYDDGIEYRSLFIKTQNNSYFSQWFTPYESLSITPKSIVGIKCYFFKDLREGGPDIIAPDIAEKLFPCIKEQAGEEKWNKIFIDKTKENH